MFSSTTTIPEPSQDFVTLCQSQVTLLYHVFHADWSAVYLTAESERENQPTHLLPIVAYPPTETVEAQISLSESWQDLTSASSLPMNRVSQGSKALPPSQLIPRELTQRTVEPYQLVLPLIHQDIVLGILVSRRQHHPWQREELTQIEKIARTLAIARLLDQRQAWSQEQLSQAYKQQQQERDRLDDLFHQIRNPLTALKIFGKLLLKQFASDDKSRGMVETIVRESEHLQELLQEFEDNQSAIAANTDIITLDSDPVDDSERSSALLLPGNPLTLTKLQVQDILQPLAITAQSLAQEKRIDIFLDIPENLSTVVGNAAGLREVLSNLIDNAIKYTPKQGKIRIQAGLLKTQAQQRYQGIAIENTGDSIPLEDQEQIFGRHYRGTQVKDRIPGSGLGLAIAKERLTQMGGIIELFSPSDPKNNCGTKFVVWLPLAG